MTDKALEAMLSDTYKEETEPTAPRTKVSLILSPHIVRNAAHLKKKHLDKKQTRLWCLWAAVFIIAFAVGGIIAYRSGNLMILAKTALIAAAVGMILTLLCAPILAWHEEQV